jgi:hypothetical protein
VARIGEPGTMLAIISNRHMLRSTSQCVAVASYG